MVYEQVRLKPASLASKNLKRNEPPHDKTNKMACAPGEDSDQPGHPPSLIRVFVVCLKKSWVLSCPLSTQRRFWSDWAGAQANLSLRWAHMPFCWFCREVAQMPFWIHQVYSLSYPCSKQQRGWSNCMDVQALLFIYDPRHEKTCLRSFWPGKTQTGLLCYRC